MTYDLKLDADGVFNGTIAEKNTEFSAFRKRNIINDFESTQKYVDDLVEDHPGLQITEFDIQNMDSINEDLLIDYHVLINDKAEEVGDLLFFTPLFYDAYEKNPLSLEEREYPVEYPYPVIDKTISKINLPNEYLVESVPESTKISLSDGNGFFEYAVNTNAENIEITSTLQINKTIFPATEYQQLKEMYEMMVKKQQEKIVLKKK